MSPRAIVGEQKPCNAKTRLDYLLPALFSIAMAIIIIMIMIIIVTAAIIIIIIMIAGMHADRGIVSCSCASAGKR